MVPDVERLQLARHPTAPSASQDFVARTLLDWGLGPLITSASLVVSELVTNATVHAGTVGLSVAWNLGALRLTGRDNSPDLPPERYSQHDVHGRGLFLVASLSRAVGVLPTADVGKGHLGRAQRRSAVPTDRPRHPEAAPAHQESPILPAPGSAGLPPFPASSPIPT